MREALTMLYPRLENWGRAIWAAIKSAGPDSSCINSIYQLGRADGDGYGVIDGNTVLADPEALIEARAEGPEIDEEDAEVIDCWVRQASPQARSILHRRFVLRQRVGGRMVYRALEEIQRLQDENAETVERMRLYHQRT